ncbi:MAG: hypothetical protein ABIQ30_11630 [Devosia sp.]
MTAALRSSVALLIVIAVAGAIPADPAFAKPNNGAFQNSSEGNKATRAKRCSNIKHNLEMAEKAADAKAGTPAAQPYSDLADQYWAQGVQFGCWQN